MQLSQFLAACVLAPGALTVLGADLKIQPRLQHECERKSRKGDTLSMHYRGTLQATGAKFDASYDRNQPFTFKVGSGQVIKGWDQGLLDMCPGDKRILTIPPELGYGDRGMGPIPAKSTLVFETELLSIQGVEPEERKVKKAMKDSANPAGDASDSTDQTEAESPVPPPNPQDEKEKAEL